MKQLVFVFSVALNFFLCQNTWAAPAAPAKNAVDKKAHAQKIQDLKLLSELSGRKINVKSDKELYAELSKAYKNHKYDDARMMVKEFEVRFSKSDLLDNAWYVGGLSAMENSNYNEALSCFQKIEKRAPKGDRVGPAKLAKAIMYKRMNLPEVSARNLKLVKKQYPGSPESARAEVELKLIR